MTDGQLTERQSLANEMNADLYLFVGPIDQTSGLRFRSLVKELTQRAPSAYLLLSTLGGDPHEAYRIARCLQRCYPDNGFAVHIDYMCKSAGTLLTLGARSLVMADRAELGPLDIQIPSQDELGKLKSGLTPDDALNYLHAQAFRQWESTFFSIYESTGRSLPTMNSAEIATKLTVGLFKGIYNQLDPLRLGEIQRKTNIAVTYGKRLADLAENFREDRLYDLVYAYPDHAFVIDREEAGNFFESLVEPSELQNRFANQLEIPSVLDVVESQGETWTMHLASPEPREAAPLEARNERPEETASSSSGSSKADPTENRFQDAPPDSAATEDVPGPNQEGLGEGNECP